MKKILFLGCLIFIISCEAPRHNPLDPKNLDNSYGVINGCLQTGSPHKPISGADVYWQNEDRLVKTNHNGEFQIDYILPNNGWLKLQKDGFFNDSVFINWGSLEKITVQQELNTIPALDSLLIYSIIRNLYPDRQTLNLAVKVRINDPDDDIDSVFVAIPDLNIKTQLGYNTTSKFYEPDSPNRELLINSAKEIIGCEIQIIVKDKSANNTIITTAFVTRVIKNPFVLESPLGHAVVSSKPVLVWKEFNPGFPFTFKVEIYLGDEPNEPPVWQKSNLPAGTKSIEVDTELISNTDYFWLIWCIDDFLNRARSKSKTFHVE